MYWWHYLNSWSYWKTTFLLFKLANKPLKVQPCLLVTVLVCLYVHVGFIKAVTCLYVYDEISYQLLCISMKFSLHRQEKISKQTWLHWWTYKMVIITDKTGNFSSSTTNVDIQCALPRSLPGPSPIHNPKNLAYSLLTSILQSSFVHLERQVLWISHSP